MPVFDDTQPSDAKPGSPPAASALHAHAEAVRWIRLAAFDAPRDARLVGGVERVGYVVAECA